MNIHEMMQDTEVSETCLLKIIVVFESKVDVVKAKL